MANAEQASLQYLEFAYEEVDGSPKRSFSKRDVEDRLGLAEDRKRDVRRDLINRGMIADQGKGTFSLRLPAIHHVEEVRLDEGDAEVVDERREERGSYLRTLHELAEGDVDARVEIDDLREELELGGTREKRAREYLDEAGLIEAFEDEVRLTQQGAGWVEGA